MIFFLVAGSCLATVVLHGALGMALSRGLATRATIVMFENVASDLVLTALLLALLNVIRPGMPRRALLAVALGLFAGAVASYFLIPFSL